MRPKAEKRQIIEDFEIFSIFLHIQLYNLQMVLMNLPKTILSERDLQQFLSYMVSMVGLSFHPDDPIAGYVKADDTPCFTEEQAGNLEKLMGESFNFCDQNGLDIYATALDIMREEYEDVWLAHSA